MMANFKWKFVAAAAQPAAAFDLRKMALSTVQLCGTGATHGLVSEIQLTYAYGRGLDLNEATDLAGGCPQRPF